MNVPEEEGLDWNIAELVAETLWDGKMFSSPQNGYAILGGPPTYPTKWRSHFAGTPIFLPQKLTLFLFGGPDLWHVPVIAPLLRRQLCG